MYTCSPVVSCPDKIIHLNLIVGYEGPCNYWSNFKNTTYIKEILTKYPLMAYDMGQTEPSLHTAGNKSNRNTAIITVASRWKFTSAPFSTSLNKILLLFHNSWIHINMMWLIVADQKLFYTCIVHVTHTYAIAIYIDNLLPSEMNCSGLYCLDTGICWTQQKLHLRWSVQSSFLQDLMCSIHVDILSRQHSSLTERSSVYVSLVLDECLYKKYMQWSHRMHIIIEVCRRTSEDLSVFVVFLIFLFYFSLQQIFSNGFSVISHPISIKFGRLIVLDETKSLNIISSQYD